MWARSTGSKNFSISPSPGSLAGLSMRSSLLSPIAGDQVFLASRRWRERADLAHLVLAPIRHEHDLLARAHRPLDDAHQHDHAAVAVVPAVEDERLERSRRIALGRRHVVDDLLEQLLDAGALLGAGGHRAG